MIKDKEEALRVLYICMCVKLLFLQSILTGIFVRFQALYNMHFIWRTLAQLGYKITVYHKPYHVTGVKMIQN